MTHKTQDEILIKALEILARDIQSDDGVANACIFEAAERLRELSKQNKELYENQQSICETNKTLCNRLKELTENQPLPEPPKEIINEK